MQTCRPPRSPRGRYPPSGPQRAVVAAVAAQQPASPITKNTSQQSVYALIGLFIIVYWCIIVYLPNKTVSVYYYFTKESRSKVFGKYTNIQRRLRVYTD